ncbi:ABC transporter ATP-binding protein [Thiosulfatimonas sediminis]|uniref:ABC transporter ATP-binding protein n=1 Tax=Thiosulfatimonas sediminis TaxID=2675054 RepID=A0A6F8PSV4_9GAMM|nr:urea ABC transporter ATP-binding protein UrtD [Thiosulfatimonas sediminis]BBP45189.1 ABC transporter ATP-binding protein [Thiosulfatimonas sediminis]
MQLRREPQHGLENVKLGDTLLYVNNISKSFDGFKALNNLSLTVNAGELRCIIGANGAGKSTMMDVITGKTKPDEGTVIFGNDIDLLKMDEPAIAKIGIGRKFQKPTVFPNHTVWENLELAMEADKGVFATLFAKMSGAQKDKLEQTIELIGLKEQPNYPAGALSHGQKQWLEIGMLLMQNPKLLLVDEPVAGMTPQEIDKTAALLNSLADEHHHSVVVVEHDMEFVRSIARKVTVLHEGSVLAENNMDAIQANEDVRRVYLGE